MILRRKLIIPMMIMAVFTLPVLASAHCQIPCGIYDDQTRFDLLKEHITTIEKSMKLIAELSAEAGLNYNQIVRWVNNKEEHAGKFMTIVTDYFMTQRIKPIDPADAEAHGVYLKKVELLHQMLVFAMKCKQTTDKAHVEKLIALVDEFENIYMSK